MRTPQTQTGMATRAFLLPPPSPCTLRTPRLQNHLRSEVSGGSSPPVVENFGIMDQESPSAEQIGDQNNGSKEEAIPICEQDGALLEEDVSIPSEQCSLARPSVDNNQETSKLPDIATNGNVPPVGEEYASSPLPPSSPLPASPFSSPARHHESDFDSRTINSLLVPDSDILLPSAGDSDGLPGVTDVAWLSDDACATSWLTGSEASAWLTETEAWLTDTEGGPLLTNSDAAWLSDSEAVFGDMSSLPPSSASNWLSDDADIDTDGEGGTTNGQDGGFDAAAFEQVIATFVERGGRSADGKDEGNGSGATSTSVAESDFWETMRPLVGGSAIKLEDGAAAAGESVDQDKVVQDLQALLGGLVGS